MHSRIILSAFTYRCYHVSTILDQLVISGKMNFGKLGDSYFWNTAATVLYKSFAGLKDQLAQGHLENGHSLYVCLL